MLILIAGVPSFAQAAPPVGHGVDLAKQQWNGDALCYSGYRDGENPDRELFPTERETLADLNILSKHWQLIRMYGADSHSERTLKVIRENHLPIKVMLGVWLSGVAGREAANKRQLAVAIDLTQRYPDVVAAVSVGNEALVSWSDHIMTEAQVIHAVDHVKKMVGCPVTVADDYLYWIKPDAALVEHVDFITLHTYPVWGREDIETGLSSTVANFKKVQLAHPGKTIVLGEVGWPTYSQGERHVPRAGDERKQKRYFEEITAWARANGVTTFFFEAFDESWKGSGTEGHWGLFTEDRKAKTAVHDLYPELKSDRPTSPSYNDVPTQVSK
jgi:exo-beta-1,3-glucanase (GH17 family)